MEKSGVKSKKKVMKDLENDLINKLNDEEEEIDEGIKSSDDEEKEDKANNE